MSIACIICQGTTGPFLTKQFHELGLAEVEYDRCNDCGFVFSRTHYEMSDAAWEELNSKWVSQYQGTDFNPEDPRWMERLEAQSKIIGDIARRGLLPAGRWLDYGAGDGKLANKLQSEQGVKFEKYEHSSNPAQGYLRIEDLKPGAFSVVMHTAVMEHLRYRKQLDFMFDLVAEDGVTILHTLVPEHIPQDPNWFYLLSVHCSFFTNRAMQALFEQHGYRCSVYNVASRLWFWFKDPAEKIRPLIEAANKETRDPSYQYIFAEKFVDYWK